MLKTKEAIVLAGGLGTRLKGVISDIPKPMAPVANQPFLKFILDYLIRQGIERVILSVGYKHEVIYDYFGDKYSDLELLYAIENEPLGTGGAIKLASEMLKGDAAFVINGDTSFDVDLSKQEAIAQLEQSELCLALKPMKAFDRYGSVEINGNIIFSFKEKQWVNEGLINGGIYWLNKSILEPFELNKRFSFEQDLMEQQVSGGEISAFVSDTYFIDIGIPEDYKQANTDFLSK